MGMYGQVAALLGSMLVLAAPAQAEGWQLAPDAEGPPRLTFSDDGKIVYRFECENSRVAVSQIGVTELLDLETNKSIGDGPGSAMTPGASLMALASDKVDPNLVAASATPNAVKGWDMTIRLPKNDPAFLSLAKAGMVSLFTTGFTRAVRLTKPDRKLLSDFVSRCRGA